jgi:hypothetical protein
VAIIKANTLEEIRHIILSEIQPIPGVIETMPCLILEDESLVEHKYSSQPVEQKL